jgi:hypothetical protein
MTTFRADGPSFASCSRPPLLVDCWLPGDGDALIHVFDPYSYRTVACWVDDEVQDGASRGDLDPHDWAGSAVAFVRRRGLDLIPPSTPEETDDATETRFRAALCLG